MCAGEIRAQPLTRLQLMRFDQGAAIASASSREPSQRAFYFIDDNLDAAAIRDDLSLCQSEMLSAKAVNDWFWKPFGLARGFSALAAKFRTPTSESREFVAAWLKSSLAASLL
jgi:hypothetical protein